MKIVVINGSYRKNGFTTACLNAIIKKKYPKDNIVNFFLQNDIHACQYCKKCEEWCRYEDQFQKIVKEIIDANIVLIGSPVYNDMPTPKLMAFLSRLSFIAERKHREFTKNTQVEILAVGYCSGTKSTIHSIMGACEMAGFDIMGRSTREYVILWKDGKIRGGRNAQDTIILDNNVLNKLNKQYLDSDYFKHMLNKK